MFKYFVPLLFCIISFGWSQDELDIPAGDHSSMNEEFITPPNVPAKDVVNSKVPMQNVVGSLENFVYLWKELQTHAGTKAMKDVLGNQNKMDMTCLQVWDDLTKMDYFPQDEFTVNNKNFVLKLCKGTIIYI